MFRFNRSVRKPRKDDPPAEAALLDAMRQTGKQEVLGLGYQMGALKFMNTLRKDPKCAFLFENGSLSPQTCVDTVYRFRSEFAAIPRLWTALEEGFKACVIVGGEAHIGRLRMASVGEDVIITLPSGRVLRYAQARLVDREGTVTYLDRMGNEAEFESSGQGLVYGAGDGINIYGGKLTENVVQAVSRDILVEAILRAEARGVLVLAHVHDEVIAMAPEERAQEVYDILMEELIRVPGWLPDVPLAAEGGIKERYMK